jgi:hypothetical protein
VTCMTCFALGDVSNLMMCTNCGHHYHGSCIGLALLPGKMSSTKVTDSMEQSPGNGDTMLSLPRCLLSCMEPEGSLPCSQNPSTCPCVQNTLGLQADHNSHCLPSYS